MGKPPSGSHARGLDGGTSLQFRDALILFRTGCVGLDGESRMFVAATALVVFVLYRREFHSSALSTLMSE